MKKSKKCNIVRLEKELEEAKKHDNPWLIFIIVFAILLGLFNCYQLSQMKKEYNEKIEKFVDTQAAPSSFSAATVTALQNLADGIVNKTDITLPCTVNVDGSIRLTNKNSAKLIVDQIFKCSVEMEA